ncbi:hypothetical protein V6N11_072711 [Hibiscus sabdariffa]
MATEEGKIQRCVSGNQAREELMKARDQKSIIAHGFNRIGKMELTEKVKEMATEEGKIQRCVSGNQAREELMKARDQKSIIAHGLEE